MYLLILHHNLQKAEKFKFENQDIFENVVEKNDYGKIWRISLLKERKYQCNLWIKLQIF